MKLTINHITLEIDEKQLAAINAAIANATIVMEQYNQETKEYEYLATDNRLQIKPVETLENFVTPGSPL